MRFFVDYHHHALARSLLTTLCGRLGHEVFFPSMRLAGEVAPAPVWHSVHDDWAEKVGLDPGHASWPRHGTVDAEEFFDLDFDFLVASRTESQGPILSLRKRHPRGKRAIPLAVSGNAGTTYDWRAFQHLISTDEGSARVAPPGVRTIVVPQEIGWAYSTRSFVPISRENLRRAACYLHAMHRWAGQWDCDAFGSRCPHCGTPARTMEKSRPAPFLDAGATWNELRCLLPDHELVAYGYENERYGGRYLDEADVAATIDATALSVHMKPSEGFGHALLQSIRRGRLAVVPERLYRYKTANRYLIPEVTCFEAAWDAKDVARIVRDFTCDLGAANELSAKCRSVADVLFDPDCEARRLEAWLHEIVERRV